MSVRNIPLHCKENITSGSLCRRRESTIKQTYLQNRPFMHWNIYTTDDQMLLIVHLNCATQWKKSWLNLLTSIDTNLDHQLENIYRLVGDIFHLLCIYSSARKVWFVCWCLQFALYTQYEFRLSFVKFRVFPKRLARGLWRGASEVTYCIDVSTFP